MIASVPTAATIALPAGRSVRRDRAFEVQAAALDKHATTVDKVADLVGQGRSAAAAVRLGRDAYGVLCQFIPALLDTLHEATITALQEAADSLQRSADDLRGTRADGVLRRGRMAITGLLAAEAPHAREMAYAAFADLEPGDREALLWYLNAERIEDTHPQI